MTYTIVVGVNDSMPCKVAVAWAAARVAGMGETAELFLVHVLDRIPDLPDATLNAIRTVGTNVLRAAEKLAVLEHPFVSVRSVLHEGELVCGIRSAAACADLVVIGTHKTGFIRGRSIGSLSLRIAAEVRAPIAIVPEAARRPYSGIVLGVKDSAGGMAALEFAGAEGVRTGQEVTLVSAWDAPRAMGADFEIAAGDLEQRNAADAERALWHAVDAITRSFPRLVSRTRLVRRPIAQALLDDSASAGLLVIGETNRGPGRSPLGAVGHDVLLNLVGPTVVIHS